MLATSYLMGWRDVPLRALLEASLGVPAAVENDVNMAALAESQIGAARGIRDFVFLAIGTGIGAGIVLNGRLFHGMNWSAGEIGYMFVPGTSVKPVESGEPGALESVVGGEGSRRNGRASGAKTVPSFRETWSPPRYSTMHLPARALAQRFSNGLRRHSPTRSTPWRSFSTARFLFWVAA